MRWTEVSLRVAPSIAEWAGDLLLRWCPQGFAESTDRRGRLRVLRAYLPVGAAGRAALVRLRRDFRRARVPVPVTSRVIRDSGWAGAWKAHARPIKIGRLTVVPSWMPNRAGRGRTVVRLDPGMAFGSGEHPTTQLCLAAIERHMRGGATVIDVGTGSGILAIAAARLGAARVLAIDNDPVAVAVARANVRANRAGSRVSIRTAAGLARVRLRADLIVGNLTAESLPGILADCSRCLRPGGWLIACGFSNVRAGEVREHVTAAGLRVMATERLRGWCAVHAAAVAV